MLGKLKEFLSDLVRLTVEALAPKAPVPVRVKRPRRY
jgi:hypothetical protein